MDEGGGPQQCWEYLIYFREAGGHNAGWVAGWPWKRVRRVTYTDTGGRRGWPVDR